MPDFEHYLDLRQRSRIFRDGLHRRVEEVVGCLRRGFPHGKFRLLDVGTADAVMLSEMREFFPRSFFVGVESYQAFLPVARSRGHNVVHCLAQQLPFAPASFDVVTLVSTLKHVPEYEAALAECRRVLVPGGHLVLSDPTPWGIRLGLWRGHFEKQFLPNIWSLAVTQKRLSEAGFEILSGYRYMPLPYRVGGNRLLEALTAKLGLSSFFMQQLVHARSGADQTPARLQS